MLQFEKNEVLVNKDKYKILELLGHGKGGYSYLAERFENVNESLPRLLVVKQIHHEPCSYYNFGNKIEAELRDYQRLSDAGIRIPRLFDFDKEAERIVKEYIAGPLISDLVRKGQMKEEYLLQVREMAKLAIKAGLNIDYYPTNFIVKKDEAGHEQLYYIDYECNEYMDEWSFEKWGIKYWRNEENTQNSSGSSL